MRERASPFLKWAGGKRWLVASNQLPAAMGDCTRYIEPFLGGGAVFFASGLSNALLSDINPDLVNAYVQVRDRLSAIVEGLDYHQSRHSKAHYYAVRDTQPDTDVKAAIRFIYLNRTCWNGLYRVNREGRFNVPIGTKTTVSFEAGELEAVSGGLEIAVIRFK